ncbi:hypothetical protein ACJJTC_006703 [Scirpophaga incertulas]
MAMFSKRLKPKVTLALAPVIPPASHGQVPPSDAIYPISTSYLKSRIPVFHVYPYIFLFCRRSLREEDVYLFGHLVIVACHRSVGRIRTMTWVESPEMMPRGPIDLRLYPM